MGEEEVVVVVMVGYYPFWRLSGMTIWRYEDFADDFELCRHLKSESSQWHIDQTVSTLSNAT